MKYLLPGYKHRNLILTVCFTFLLIGLFYAPVTFAQGSFAINCPNRQVYIAIFDMCVDFAGVIGLGVSWSLLLGTLMALVQLGIGSARMIMSTGKPGKLENARDTMTDAMLGLVMIASAWVILGYISKTFPPEWGISFFVLPFGLGG